MPDCQDAALLLPCYVNVCELVCECLSPSQTGHHNACPDCCVFLLVLNQINCDLWPHWQARLRLRLLAVCASTHQICLSPSSPSLHITGSGVLVCSVLLHSSINLTVSRLECGAWFPCSLTRSDHVLVSAASHTSLKPGVHTASL